MHSGDRSTDLFGGADFIMSDVFFNKTNSGAPKKHTSYPGRYPSGGLVAGRTF